MATKNVNAAYVTNVANDVADAGEDSWTAGRRDGGVSFRKTGRTKLEKLLLLLVVAFLTALVAVVVVFILSKEKHTTNLQQQPSSSGLPRFSSRVRRQLSSVFRTVRGEAPIRPTEPGVCQTKECVDAAARIDRYIDYSTDSCQDFYQFACGRWIKETIIPSDSAIYDTFSILYDQVNIVLKNLLEEADHPTDLGCIKKAKDFYSSCMNIDIINSRGDTHFRELLVSVFGGWPLVTSNWSEVNFDLVSTLVRLTTQGVLAMITFNVQLDHKNSTKYVFKMDQPTLGMPGQKYYLVPRNDTRLMAYEEFIFQVAQLLGFVHPSSARQEVADIVNFEILLANISVPDEQRRDSMTMTLAEVHANYSQFGVFDWMTYVRSLTSLPQLGLTDITDEEIIINKSPAYYQRLKDVLAATPNRTVANYLIWMFVRYMVHTLGDNYIAAAVAYDEALFGTSTAGPRFTLCLHSATKNLGLAVGRMYIQDNFDEDAKTIVLDMTRDLQNAFNELLNDNDWMDEDTKKVAKEKNEFISPKIGYPDELINDTYLDYYYENLTFHKDQYFENILAVYRESFNSNFRRLRETVDKSKWEIPPSSVNAYYNTFRNQILFPAGILQPPFFSKHFPKSLNYGGVGHLIGHEMTHAFDYDGGKFDKDGNQAQWWSPVSVEKFKNKTQCIVQQYGNFTVPEVNLTLNGINTQEENIADNGGLKQAFKAYRNWVAAQGKEEPLLPGLKFNHNQLFFINFAQLSCQLMREGGAHYSIKTGSYSPERFKVIGSVQNSPDFAQAFKCPVGSKMNPKEKCSVF